MSLYFNNCAVYVDNSGILADSVSLSSENGISKVNLLGYKDGFNKVIVGPVQNNLNLNYFPETSNEPIFSTCQYLSTGYENFNILPQQIVIGGVSGQFYLQSYNLSINPNEIIKSSASFIGYSEMSGSFTENQSYTYQNTASNGNFVTFYKDSNIVPVRVYDFNYQLEASWTPEYVLGQTSPLQVQLSEKTETIRLTNDTFSKVLYSGQSFLQNYSNTFNKIVIFSTGAGILEIPLTGYTLKSSDTRSTLDNAVLQNLLFIK